MMKKLLFLVCYLAGLTPAALAEEADFTAIYSLPYSEEYKEFLDYKFEILQWSDQNNTVMFRYILPDDLVGATNMQMTMFGTYTEDNQFFQIFCDRTDSTGMCIRSGDSIACSVKFRNIPLNADTTNSFLEAKYGEDRIVERKKAADSFLRDAIGNLSIAIRR
jgi:hypothetical protein